MTTPIVTRPVLFQNCAGCDGPMESRRDAIGREVLRCPKCSPFAPTPRRHPDDAMLPQGLVKAGTVRVVQRIVRVVEPAPPPITVEALPPIRLGQLHCQWCATAVHPSCRFCPDCAARGQAIVDEAKRHAAKVRAPGQRFREKACESCGTVFQPTGPASKFCEDHRR